MTYDSRLLPRNIPNTPTLQTSFDNDSYTPISHIPRPRLRESHDFLSYIPNFNSKSTYHWIKVAVWITLKLILAIIVADLSWNCNKDVNILLRIIITILAILFSEIYILYYAIYRKLIGSKCF